MKKEISTFLLLGILLMAMIGLTSAITIHPGESFTWDFSNETEVVDNITYEILNNTYDLQGLNIEINGSKATLSLDKNFQPDNFSILFTINGKVNVEESVSGSSGNQRGGGFFVKPKVEDEDNITTTGGAGGGKFIPDGPEEKPKNVGWKILFWILLIGGLLSIIYFSIRSYKSYQKFRKEKNGKQ